MVGDSANDYQTFVTKVVLINGKKFSEESNEPIITTGGATGGATDATGIGTDDGR